MRSDDDRRRAREASRRYRERRKQAAPPAPPRTRGPAANRVLYEPGTRFGRLVVLALDDQRTDGGGLRWRCRCDCGREVVAWGTALRKGHTASCGCWRRDQSAGSHTVHGARFTPEYQVWLAMRQRCTNPKHASYPNYGGRGVTVCARWDDFAAFLADVGPRPSPRHSIDRVDNARPYEPGNVRWSTRTEQTRNRRVTLTLTYRGRTQSIAAWAEETGLSYDTLRSRVNRYGWTAERALTTP